MVNLDYLYNPDATKELLTRNYLVNKKMGFQTIEHGTFLPYKKLIDGKSTEDGWGFGGIIDSNNEFVGSSHVVNGAGSCYTPPPNQFNTVQRLSFTSACFIALGDTQLLTISVVSGF